ncbi:MAG: hypothetical protein ACPL7D_09560, partial [Candidatus Sumerlaeaceae bacterium]
RQRSLVFVGAFLGIFLYNAGYYLWWGGWGLAPRFLAVGVPFLALLSVPALSSLAARVIYVLAGSWGVCAYVVMNFMPHDFPERPHGAPLESLLFPDFAHFEYPNLFARYVCPKFLLGETDWSLATALGLSGLSALIPLAIVWLGIYAAFIVSLPRAPLTAAE